MSKYNLHVAALIPPHLAPNDVIAALHDHSTCLTLQALTTGHKKLPETNPETRKDTYWYPPDINPIHTYEVTECITFLPGVGEWGKRYITFPSCFQDTPHGIKTRADAPGGVTLRAEYRVIKGGSGEGEVDGEGEGIGYADWVLVEDVEVTCAWYIMPFVRRSMEGAHRDICKKVIEKVEMAKRQEALEKTIQGKRQEVMERSGRGKGKERAMESPSEESLQERRNEAEDTEEAEALPDKITYG